jgi:uncharacterized damage-inducible protein DinB
MAIKDALLPEFDHEAGTTRRVLERVPEDKLTWKPHEKSMSMGRLATHVAEVLGYGPMTLEKTEIDFASGSYKPLTAANREELLALFDKNVAATRKLLEAVSDAELGAMWTMKADGKAVFGAPRATVWRTFVMNHLVHHRGQLSVYLRENDVPVPSIYGPSADERQ